jgi:nucleoside-diphosphate-sugar epimerase
MRVVVAGGAGFLGSHLCDSLLARGDEVLAVDNLSTGSLENLAHHESTDGFRFLMADVTHDIPHEGSVDAIVNLASPASPAAYLAMPLETMLVGSEGTRCLLELAQTHGARFIQASTSEVYGDPHVHPQREDYWGNVNPIGPRSVYDESKRFAEALVMAYRRARATNVGIARIFNTYGPRLAPGDGRVVSNFICQALRGEPLTVYGDGRQTRSLCYVADTVRGLLSLLDSQESGPVNLGNPTELTMLALAQEIVKATSSSSTIEFKDLPVDDPQQRCPDIALAESTLGWAPQVPLRKGLAETIHYFESKLQSYPDASSMTA